MGRRKRREEERRGAESLLQEGESGGVVVQEGGPRGAVVPEGGTGEAGPAKKRSKRCEPEAEVLA